MTTITIKKGFENKHGETVEQVVALLAKGQARTIVAAPSVADLTDSSTGVATNPKVLVAANTALVNVANSGTSLVSTATATSSLGTVVDAVAELYAKANAYATKLGLPTVTYSGGGAAPDGTVNAITTSTTAATTGAQALNLNADIAAINTAIYNVGVLANTVLHAVGQTEVVLYQDTISATIGALSTAPGTAADPGVTKVAMDAVLVQLAANVATLAAALNTANDGLTTALVVAVK